MSGDSVSIPIDYEEVAEFAHLLGSVDPAIVPRHLAARCKALRNFVEIVKEGPGLSAVLNPEARALAATLRALAWPLPAALRPD